MPGGHRQRALRLVDDAITEVERGISFDDLLEDVKAARKDLLTTQGTLMPGAAEALRAVAALDGVVQSVLTGSSRPNAATVVATACWLSASEVASPTVTATESPKSRRCRPWRQSRNQRHSACCAAR